MQTPYMYSRVINPGLRGGGQQGYPPHADILVKRLKIAGWCLKSRDAVKNLRVWRLMGQLLIEPSRVVHGFLLLPEGEMGRYNMTMDVGGARTSR